MNVPNPEFVDAKPLCPVKYLTVVDWKHMADRCRAEYCPGYGPEGEALHTIYVAHDGSYVRWHPDERYTSTGEALVMAIRAAGGHWHSSTGWTIGAEEASNRVKQRVLAKIRELARAAKWKEVDAASLTAPQSLPIGARQCGSDGWILTTHFSDWRRLGAEDRAARLPKALERLGACNRYAWVHGHADPDFLMSAPMTADELNGRLDNLRDHGWEIDCPVLPAPADVERWSQIPVQATIGELVKIRVSLDNPLHLIVIDHEIQKTKRGGSVEPNVTLPLAEWQEIATRFQAMGGGIEETRRPRRFANSFDPTKVPGWEKPAPNGHMLRDYQRMGVEFLVANNMRAILADEMGLGKTAQAICAAEAVGARRKLVIVPAMARRVWEDEIHGWAENEGSVVHLRDALSDVDLPQEGWVIVTYDLLTPHVEIWKPNSQAEAEKLNLGTDEMRALSPTEKSISLPKETEGNAFRPLRFDPVMTSEIGFLLQSIQLPDRDRTVQLHRMGRRLSGEQLKRIAVWNPDIIFVDEAHRIKNSKAARTNAVRRILEDEGRGAVLISGTPLRNHSGEGAALIEAVFSGAVHGLARYNARHRGRLEAFEAQNKAVATLLGKFMIRRRKSELLELPPKSRQIFEVEPTGIYFDVYCETLLFARDELRKQIGEGKTLKQARHAVINLLAIARRFLGLAKIENGDVADQINETIEQKNCCVVFTAHRAVSDGLADQLRKKKRSVTVVDGRTTQEARAEAVSAFENGKIEVFVGGINTAGESITLTRADTCYFVELDWVPAAMMQAEDRGHRLGQKADLYHIISIIANSTDHVSLDEDIASILQQKLANINETLGEDKQLIGDSGSKSTILDRIAARLLSEDDLQRAQKNAERGKGPSREIEEPKDVDIPIDEGDDEALGALRKSRKLKRRKR